MNLKIEGPKNKVIFVKVNEETRETIENLAEKYNTSMSEVTRKLIAEGLKATESK